MIISWGNITSGWFKFRQHQFHLSPFQKSWFLNISAKDACVDQPCENGGTCNNYYDYYTCTCPAHFTGPLCQEGKLCSTVQYNLINNKISWRDVGFHLVGSVCYVTEQVFFYSQLHHSTPVFKWGVTSNRGVPSAVKLLCMCRTSVDSSDPKIPDH